MFPAFPPSASALMSATIAQAIIPLGFGIPDTIRVHHITQNDWGVIAQHVYDKHASVCGVALRISRDYGDLDMVAFSTPADVFAVTLGTTSHSPKASQGRGPLARILDGSRCVLAGFGMARIALHLYRQWSLHVEGVDLTSLFPINGSKLQTPAEFASRRIHPDVDIHKIHALWYGDTVKDLCLHALNGASFFLERQRSIRLALQRCYRAPVAPAKFIY
ncbi:hypothetical protein NUW54_g10782 [Trametes sanguinea]|uniref:Uncharacterized protein n=1 Tax=Trametes sanguinea TaxID=158606 RepID=A0ACC1NUV1_9APHY|nr:hypothetical protein NUW54_g10782 [Trametes sanguinea]